MIEESDLARKFLTTFWDSYPSFKTWAQNLSYPDDLLISAHKTALEMIEREGLEVLSSLQRSQPELYTSNPVQLFPEPVPEIIWHTDGIALCYGGLSDLANFQKWVAKAFTLRLRRSGFGSTVQSGLGAFNEDIEWIDGPPEFQKMRKVLENWIENPEKFPAWGLRRSNPEGGEGDINVIK